MAKFIELSCAPEGVKKIFNADFIYDVQKSSSNNDVMQTLVCFAFNRKDLRGEESQDFIYVLESYDEIKAMLGVSGETKLA